MNPSVATALEAAGMKLVGRNNDGTGERMEVLELEEDRHPYFMGAQVCSSLAPKLSVRSFGCVHVIVVHVRSLL